ncbi:hypothetical protein ADUPG1_012552 [Aduncisulcus paluster]|uniref:Vacuolar protein sorting-associated protein 53 homolog n=1 Tax=Aduncisulcus paluster TaxID=2918883 RepID=A0ABQ5K1Y4_9EUKA|nr:hypothetical protein ADUPG1_012552 [Aduncisulcus paluster]
MLVFAAKIPEEPATIIYQCIRLFLESLLYIPQTTKVQEKICNMLVHFADSIHTHPKIQYYQCFTEFTEEQLAIRPDLIKKRATAQEIIEKVKLACDKCSEDDDRMEVVIEEGTMPRLMTGKLLSFYKLFYGDIEDVMSPMKTFVDWKREHVSLSSKTLFLFELILCNMVKISPFHVQTAAKAFQNICIKCNYFKDFQNRCFFLGKSLVETIKSYNSEPHPYVSSSILIIRDSITSIFNISALQKVVHTGISGEVPSLKSVACVLSGWSGKRRHSDSEAEYTVESDPIYKYFSKASSGLFTSLNQNSTLPELQETLENLNTLAYLLKKKHKLIIQGQSSHELIKDSIVYPPDDVIIESEKLIDSMHESASTIDYSILSSYFVEYCKIFLERIQMFQKIQAFVTDPSKKLSEKQSTALKEVISSTKELFSDFKSPFSFDSYKLDHSITNPVFRCAHHKRLLSKLTKQSKKESKKESSDTASLISQPEKEECSILRPSHSGEETTDILSYLLRIQQELPAKKKKCAARSSILDGLFDKI